MNEPGQQFEFSCGLFIFKLDVESMASTCKAGDWQIIRGGELLGR